MKKLLFGITGLTLGGAERVLVDLANRLCDKYDITIFTIYAKGELEKQLSPKVKLKSLYDVRYDELSKKQKVLIPLKLYFNKKRVYKKKIKGDYDTEIAFLEGPVTRLFSVKNKNTRKIAWIHNDISLVFGTGIKAKIKKEADRKIYSKYDTLVFVSRDNMKKFREVYKDTVRNEYLEPVKKEVIYNYIDSEKVIEKAGEKPEIIFDKSKLNFVTVARLVPQKAIDRLIRIHSKLIENNLEHNFYVIGDGPEKERLENMIEEYNVSNTFHLLGKKENPYPYIKNADYFCLLSNFEGYGMVLEEAKILGKSIIITNTAAREAVEKYEDSVIIENNEEKIYEELKEIIENNNKNKGKIRLQESRKYDNSNIINKIVKLIGE